MQFDTGVFYGWLVQGDLHHAIEYAKKYSSEEVRLARYEQLFEKQQYITYPVSQRAQNILLAYQLYYRDVFYIRMSSEAAATMLQSRLTELIDCDPSLTLDNLEDTILPSIFQEDGLHFMGGKTGGFYGPYVWKSTEEKTYQVELPAGIQPYTVRLHRDFLTKSWLDYISFGEISTGGWSNGDGVIDCIADCYDITSEAFFVSLLKHEAQHAQDLKKYHGIAQDELEYRAKIVELIYSEERDLMADYQQQSGDANSHSRAAKRICEAICDINNRKEIQEKAKRLLEASNEELIYLD